MRYLRDTIFANFRCVTVSCLLIRNVQDQYGAQSTRRCLVHQHAASYFVFVCSFRFQNAVVGTTYV
jgi:hypothetical protein